MAGNAHIRRPTDYDTSRPVSISIEDDFLPQGERKPAAPPERLLALSVIWQAVSDLQNLRLGRPHDATHYTAAAFLVGRDDYQPILRFWCQVANVDQAAVTARAWRQLRTRLVMVLRQGPPAPRRPGRKPRTIPHV